MKITSLKKVKKSLSRLVSFLKTIFSNKPYAEDTFALLGSLKTAISNGELVLHYQIQQDLRTRKPVGVEALLRWNHPTLGLVYPDYFIPLAEHHDLITQISLWIAKQGMADLKRLNDLGYKDFNMALNMSPYCRVTNELLDAFKQEFAARNIDPNNVTFEITETVIAMSQAHTLSVLKELDSLGVDLSIDDFGTGQSSLVYLRKLPISELKVDREFVTNMLDDEQNYYIVQAIVNLAQGLHCRSVAEGIETKEVYDAVRAMNCDVAQGYYIAEPLPFNEMVAKLKQLNA